MDFLLLSGSANGANHIEAATNGHDALSVRHTNDSIVAVVADGCSSQPHSEVGAKIVAPMVTNYVAQVLRKGLSLSDPRVRRNIRDRILSRIMVLADEMAGDDPTAPVLNAHFQFTILGVAMTPTDTFFFRIGGDGMYGVNNETHVVYPEKGNRPAYLVYALTGSPMTDADPTLTDFQILHTLPTSDVKTFWIGTDGTGEMLAAVNKTVNREPVVSVEGLLETDRYYDKPALLSRRLQQLVAADVIGDDITLVAGKRLTALSDPAPAVAEEETGAEPVASVETEVAAEGKAGAVIMTAEAGPGSATKTDPKPESRNK